MVRGITPDYFSGHRERAQDDSIVYKYGLSRCFTVYSTRSQVNPNFAALPVLMSIPGMPPQAANMIYQRRREKPFRNLQDLIREIAVPLGTPVQSFLAFDQTGVYTLTVAAQAQNSKAKRVIRTVISLTPGERSQYQTLYWNENIPDYEGTVP